MRFTLEAFAPLLFGLVSEQFGGGPATIGPSGSVVVSGAAGLRRVDGLQVAFLLMCIPLAGAGVLLLLQRRHYAVDVASAAEAERRAKAGGRRRPAA